MHITRIEINEEGQIFSVRLQRSLPFADHGDTIYLGYEEAKTFRDQLSNLIVGYEKHFAPGEGLTLD